MLSVRYRTKGFEIRLHCEQRQDLSQRAQAKSWRRPKKMARHSRTTEKQSGRFCQRIYAFTCEKSISPS